MQLTVGDLFGAITLPLLITFILAYFRILERFSDLEKPLSRIEAHTARLPQIAQLVREYLQKFNGAFSTHRQWAADFERSLGKGA